MHENETVKKEDLLEIANWIMKVAEQSSFAHDELKALHYADTVRGAADQAETLRSAMNELDQCHENLKRGSKMLRERNVQIEALQKGKAIANRKLDSVLKKVPKCGKWIRIDKHTIQCPLCHRYLDLRGVNAGRGDANYCPNCGAKMEVRDDS